MSLLTVNLLRLDLLRKEGGVEEETAPFIYRMISVRFKFYCRSLLSVKKNLIFFLIE